MVFSHSKRKLAAVLLLFLVYFPLQACQRSRAYRAGPASSSSAEPAAPKLKLAQPKLDMGPMVQDEAAKRSLAISNVGTLALEIGKIDSSRFCSGSIEPSILAPGASGTLEVTCRSDLYGPMNEALDIHTNDPKSPKTTLNLVATVTPLLAFDAPSITAEMFFGQERTEEVHLVGILLDKARIKLKQPAVADVEILPQPPGTEKIRSFRVHCKGHKVGSNVGNIVISTGLVRPKEVAISYECRVTGTLAINPTNPVFNLKVSGTKAVTIDVRSSQPNFEVMGVNVVEGPFAASFGHAPEGPSFLVKVTVLDDQIDDETRGVTGKLIIISNDRTEPQKEVPLFGLGQVNRATPLAPEQAP